MLRAVVKPLEYSIRQYVSTARAWAAAEQAAHSQERPAQAAAQHRDARAESSLVVITRGPDVSRGSKPSSRLLSEHARCSRGPQRLCSLDPDT
jgi:hypothetical protein